MKRYPAFDPPEYVGWQADPALVAEYRARVAADPARAELVRELDEAALLALYAGMVRNRLHDHALQRWVRQGVISKAWLGRGEEAVTIGAVHALERGEPADRDGRGNGSAARLGAGDAAGRGAGDVVAPMIRNAGACHEFGMPVADMLRGYLATGDAPNGGRDGHVGAFVLGVLPPVSPVGDMVPVIVGVALAFRLRREPRVALTWVGDGATGTGACHEGLSFAAAQRVPAIFVLQDNQVALGTRAEAMHRGDFGDWPRLYELPGARADGNNVLDVYAATRLAARRVRGTDEGPFLLVADTFRMGGHATHDEAEARATFDPELFRYWGARDPIGLYEEYLVEEGMPRARLAEVEAEVTAEVEAAADAALASRTSAPAVAEHAEYAGFSAGVRQPGLAGRLDPRAPGS